MELSKSEYIYALKQKGVLNERRIIVLKAFYENMYYKATSTQIGKRIGHHQGTVNLRFGTLGKKISEITKKYPTKRENGTYQWWKILAVGTREPNGFNWELHGNLIDALLELNIFSENTIFPEEIVIDKFEFVEGSIKKVFVNSYERNSLAREKCIEIHGINCKVCNVNFEEIYGSIGNGFIHVHHITKISEMNGLEYKVNPISDLIPVCPNCHAMLHRRDPPFTIAELKEIVKMHYH